MQRGRLALYLESLWKRFDDDEAFLLLERLSFENDSVYKGAVLYERRPPSVGRRTFRKRICNARAGLIMFLGLLYISLSNTFMNLPTISSKLVSIF